MYSDGVGSMRATPPVRRGAQQASRRAASRLRVRTGDRRSPSAAVRWLRIARLPLIPPPWRAPPPRRGQASHASPGSRRAEHALRERQTLPRLQRAFPVLPAARPTARAPLPRLPPPRYRTTTPTFKDLRARCASIQFVYSAAVACAFLSSGAAHLHWQLPQSLAHENPATRLRAACGQAPETSPRAGASSRG